MKALPVLGVKLLVQRDVVITYKINEGNKSEGKGRE